MHGRGRDRASSSEVVGEPQQDGRFRQAGRRDRHRSALERDAAGIGQGCGARHGGERHARRPRAAIAIPVLAANPAITETTRLEVSPARPAQDRSGPFGLEGTNERDPGGLGAAAAQPARSGCSSSSSIPTAASSRRSRPPSPSSTCKRLVKLDDRQSARRSKSTSGAAIEKLRGFQTDERRLLLLAGPSDEVHEWTTTYAGYFLLEAARLGYHVPAAMLDAWQTHQKTLANAWTAGGGRRRARSRPSGCSRWPWPATPTSGP
ncbi:MAG: hypothetical protein MZV64_33830 [Ignavibacteriales bacterium]|nr:hypothetical protein [Ignavibacteriales bacterium]